MLPSASSTSSVWADASYPTERIWPELTFLRSMPCVLQSGKGTPLQKWTDEGARGTRPPARHRDALKQYSAGYLPLTLQATGAGPIGCCERSGFANPTVVR